MFLYTGRKGARARTYQNQSVSERPFPFLKSLGYDYIIIEIKN